ncbi:MAG: isoamylase early set domain-containing protein [Gemmatirosa sp.]
MSPVDNHRTWRDDAVLDDTERDLPLPADALAALRAEVPVRPEWRAAVLREVARPASRRGWWARARSRTWTLSPLAGIAAGALCAALGAGGAWLADRGAVARPVVAAAPTAPAPSTVRFVFVAPRAAHVALVGDFNRWDPSRTPMRASADGLTWSVELPLAPGRHAYAFVVDGDVVADPAAPRAVDDDFGVPNSVVLVGSPST